MVLLSSVELLGRKDLGNNLPAQQLLLLFQRIFSCFLLFRGVVVYSWSVLCSNVISLSHKKIQLSLLPSSYHSWTLNHQSSIIIKRLRLLHVTNQAITITTCSWTLNHQSSDYDYYMSKLFSTFLYAHELFFLEIHHILSATEYFFPGIWFDSNSPKEHVEPQFTKHD
jgi:hypothetical protein